MSDNSLPIHSSFDDPKADLIIQSADGVRFHLQRKYLEANTGAFPPAEFDTQGAITHLTETSAVLETLFQFVYPRRHPNLEDMDFDAVVVVAEAAEKYEVFNAMNICCMRMSQFLPSHAGGIFAHAARHDYPKLIQDAAPFLARLPMSAVLPRLPPHFFEPWARYREAWDNVFEDALKKINSAAVHGNIANVLAWGTMPTNPNRPLTCYACLFTMIIVVKELQSIESSKDLELSLAKPRVTPVCCPFGGSCRYTTILPALCTDILVRIKKIPLFSTFMSGT